MSPMIQLFLVQYLTLAITRCSSSMHAGLPTERTTRLLRHRRRHNPTILATCDACSQLRMPVVVQYLTLAFIGFISASSMRGFLRDMRRAFSAIAGGGNATTLVLLLTELMGLYAISSLLLIRKQLPLRYR